MTNDTPKLVLVHQNVGLAMLSQTPENSTARWPVHRLIKQDWKHAIGQNLAPDDSVYPGCVVTPYAHYYKHRKSGTKTCSKLKSRRYLRQRFVLCEEMQ